MSSEPEFKLYQTFWFGFFFPLKLTLVLAENGHRSVHKCTTCYKGRERGEKFTSFWHKW